MCVAVGYGAMGQKPNKNYHAPTVLSVGDIVGNYGLDSAWVNDTAAAMRYLEEQPEDYVVLTNLCVSIAQRPRKQLPRLRTTMSFATASSG